MLNGLSKAPDRSCFVCWTGLLIIIGIFVGCHLEAPYGEHMPVVAWGALAELIVSTATGYIFESRTDGDNQGLWGFNGILVGCARIHFLDNTDGRDSSLGKALRSSPSRGSSNVFAPVQDHILHIPLYPHIVAYTPVGARYGPPYTGRRVHSLAPLRKSPRATFNIPLPTL